jgi:hypothetical protein
VSEENAKLTQDAFAAYNRSRVDAELEYVHPTAEPVAPPEWPEEPVLRGHAGVRQIMAS